MAQNTQKTPVPSGWYPDPTDSHINRWWSGTEWTRDTSPRELVEEVVTATRADAGSAIRDAETAIRAAANRTAATGTAAPPTNATPGNAPVTSATRVNTAASYAASSSRPSAPAAPFRAPTRSRSVPEISQPPYAFNRTMSTFALVGVVVGLGLIALLLLN